MSDILSRLKEIRLELFVPKGRKGQHYQYRNTTDILKAVYPLLEDDEDVGVRTEIKKIGDWHYAVSEATFWKGDKQITHQGFAREPENPKQMSTQQASGASQTFSKKYALDSLFQLIDERLDPDILQNGTDEFISKDQQKEIMSLFLDKGFDEYRIGKFLEYAEAETVDTILSSKFNDIITKLKAVK